MEPAEPAVWVWIASFPAAGFRFEQRRGEINDRRNRHRLSLDDLASCVQSPAPKSAQQAEYHGNQPVIKGLLKLTPGITWSGPLTNWPGTAIAQRRLWKQPEDAYSVKVLSCWNLRNGLQILLQRTGSGEARIEQRTASMCFYPVGPTGEEAVSDGADVVAAKAAIHPQELAMTRAVQLPDVLVANSGMNAADQLNQCEHSKPPSGAD